MMQPSRRQVLRLGVVAAAASGPLALAERALAVVAVRLTRRTFRPLVGSAFRFSAAGRSYTAVLASVGNLPNSRPGDENRFRLMFTVRGGGPAQGTYRFTHPKLAPFPLFVVPVGRGGTTYEAVVVSA